MNKTEDAGQTLPGSIIKRGEMRIYISGQITGMKDGNKPAFNEAETYLLSKGHEVVNPTRIEEQKGYKWENYMRIALRKMLVCDAVFMLKNWKLSRGARLEHNLAAELGFKLMYQEEN